MARICVRDGRFVERESGRQFHPRGFSYIRLRPRWHGTFAPERYDAARAEAMLADVAAHGFNVVRVFIDHTPGEGVVASADAEELSPAFMAHVADFIGRARRHGVRVVPSLIHLPRCARTQALLGPGPERIEGVNRMLLHQGHIAAKATYVADFVAALEARDPALLPAVFAYELCNEAHFSAAAPPFSLDSGTVVPADGERYDLASEADLQRMADANAVRWAAQCARAIREVDPAAMVSANVFTFAAVGRGGPGRLRRDESSDPRFPVRPLALARSSLDYLDVHFYPFDERTLERDLRSIEFPQLRAACRAAGKPLVMGEFGAFKKAYPRLEGAAQAMARHARRVLDLGFAGYIYWTYDTDEQAFLWNAKSGEGDPILRALAAVSP
ncbi:MAG: cellulase family glycosylhydrolase [Candidatus Brocadiia bacterium]